MFNGGIHNGMNKQRRTLQSARGTRWGSGAAGCLLGQEPAAACSRRNATCAAGKLRCKDGSPCQPSANNTHSEQHLRLALQRCTNAYPFVWGQHGISQEHHECNWQTDHLTCPKPVISARCVLRINMKLAFARLTSSPASCSPRSSTSSQHASSADATCCSAPPPPSRGCPPPAASHLLPRTPLNFASGPRLPLCVQLTNMGNYCHAS